MLCRQWSMFIVVTFLCNSLAYAHRKTSSRSSFSCFKCTHHDKPQEMKEAACMKKFDPSKYTQEGCVSDNGPGKCLKSYAKTEARTKKQIEDDERSLTVRKCVSQGELEYLKNVRNIDTSDGCHTIRSTKTKHKRVITTAVYASSPDQSSIPYGYSPSSNRVNKKFFTNSEKSVIDLNSNDGQYLPTNFRASFRHIHPKEPEKKHGPKTTLHGRRHVQQHILLPPSDSEMSLKNPSVQDRPTAVGNKHPFIRPSRQVNNQQTEIPPRPVHPQRSKRTVTKPETIPAKVDPRQVRKPVKLLDYTDTMSKDHRYAVVSNGNASNS
ncbi:hypothetical protein I4U23_001748 [Adineta vaga]|nr:hypothetical protein I4U23_001748 [Adineta vaga]